MTDTTTISITEEQRDRLSDRKQHDRESYKAVIARLLDGDTADKAGKADVDGRIELLKRIERAASTVEERTGRIERQLEDMGGR